MALTVRIQKRWGDFLLDVDFEAEAGRTLALLGASGCGKSLTLQCVAGVRRPDRGRIVLDGRVLFDSAAGVDLPPQQRRVGYLFQQYALFPNMTVEGNIAAALGRLPKEARRRRTAELTALLRLEGLERRYPRQLSGGQQQRAALARLLAPEPRAILLDEPFSALDSHLRGELEWELRELLDRFPGPVVWVSHDRGEVCRNCRQVCVLEQGRSAPARDTGDLMANPLTVSAARLSGCRNLLPVRPGPREGWVEVPGWDLALRAAVPWREGVTTLGIRASALHPAAPGEENAFPCRAVRAVEDADALRVLLRPRRGEGPPLEMALPGRVAPPEGEVFFAAVRPEDLMLLEEEETACTKPRF